MITDLAEPKEPVFAEVGGTGEIVVSRGTKYSDIASYPVYNGIPLNQRSDLELPFRQYREFGDTGLVGLRVITNITGVPKDGKGYTGDAAVSDLEIGKDGSLRFSAVVADGISDPVAESDGRFSDATAKALVRYFMKRNEFGKSSVNFLQVLYGNQLDYQDFPSSLPIIYRGFCGLNDEVYVGDTFTHDRIAKLQAIPEALLLQVIEPISQLIHNELDGVEAYGPFALADIEITPHDRDGQALVTGVFASNLDCQAALVINEREVFLPAMPRLVNIMDGLTKGYGIHPLDPLARRTKALNTGAMPCLKPQNLTLAFCAFSTMLRPVPRCGLELRLKTDGVSPASDDFTSISIAAKVQSRSKI